MSPDETIGRFVDDKLYPFCKKALRAERADTQRILSSTDVSSLPHLHRVYFYCHRYRLHYAAYKIKEGDAKRQKNLRTVQDDLIACWNNSQPEDATSVVLTEWPDGPKTNAEMRPTIGSRARETAWQASKTFQHTV
jgi:hypothetical protein